MNFMNRAWLYIVRKRGKSIMALDRAIRGGGDTGASINDERGLLLL